MRKWMFKPNKVRRTELSKNSKIGFRFKAKKKFEEGGEWAFEASLLEEHIGSLKEGTSSDFIFCSPSSQSCIVR